MMTSQRVDVEEYRVALGRRLREARERAGMTLAEVERRTTAAGFRLPRSTINDIESGRSALSVEAVAVLASVLGFGTIDLVSQVISSLGRVKARGASSEELRRRGVELARQGVDLEAAWYFDAAAGSASSREERARMEINASHCYFMAGAYEISLRKVEDVLDREDLPVEIRLSARSRQAFLLAAMDRRGRAKDSLLLVRVIREDVRRGRSLPYSLAVEAWAGLVLGLPGEEVLSAARRAVRGFRARQEGGDAARAMCAEALCLRRLGRSTKALAVVDRAAELVTAISDDTARGLVAVTRAATGVREEGYDSLCELLEFAAVPRPPIRHRAETLAAWWLLEKAALREGKYDAARRWRRRAAGVADPVARRLAGLYADPSDRSGNAGEAGR